MAILVKETPKCHLYTPKPWLVDVRVLSRVKACQVFHEELAGVEGGLIGNWCKQCGICELPAVPVHP